jgi:aminotransferase
LVERLVLHHGVAALPGEAFGPSGEGFVRCSYATSLDRLEAAAERIQRFTARHKTRASAEPVPAGK